MTTASDMVHEHSADMQQIFRNPSLAPFVPLMTHRCSLIELEILEATPLRESRIRLCLAAVVSTRRPHTALRRVLKMLSFWGPWPYVLPFGGSHDCLFSLSGTKILKKAQAALPKETQSLSSAALEAPDLNAVSLGKKHMFTAAEAIVWDELGHGAAAEHGDFKTC